MTRDEFLQLLQTKDDTELLDECLHDQSPPYVVRSARDWNAFRDAIVSAVGAKREDIRIVGSGRFGFSMRPRNNLRRFSDDSDIDVLVVNADLFDFFWLSLLTAAYPRNALFQKAGGWGLFARRELYAGWLTPVQVHIDGKILGAKARPVLDFKAKWFNGLKQAGRYPSRHHHDVQGRLYRTWRHAELYHLHSLSELRRSL
jgi:hypothetical protein